MKLILVFSAWLVTCISESKSKPHHVGISSIEILETNNFKPKLASVPLQLHHRSVRVLDPEDSTSKLVVPLKSHRRIIRGLKNLDIELLSEESRHKNKRQSYNRKSPPKRTHYQTHDRHSDGGRTGKGGYHKTDSYKGNKGYSDYTTFDRANKNSYGDGDHKQYGSRDGGHSGGGHEGGNSYGGQSGGSRNGHGNRGGYFGDGGRGKYSREYSDNGNSYLRAGGGYR